MQIAVDVRQFGWPLLWAAMFAAVAGGCAQPPLQGTGPTFTVVTYNVRNAALDLEATFDAIEQLDADIFCLQETNPQWERRLRDRFSDQYPHMTFRHEGKYGGLGFLAKRPLTHKRYGKADVGVFPAWLVEAETAAGPVQVLAVHLISPATNSIETIPNREGDFAKLRRREIEHYAQWLDPEFPAIIAGDFNDGNGSRVGDWLEERGFRDAMSRDPWAGTWRGEVYLLPVRLRLDHIFSSPQLVCLNGRAVPGGGSDHFPVLGEYQRRKTGPATEKALVAEAQ
jgi:endonuclease/exonuclease/phosphatase (EEP) superfamily protein YafD